MKRALTPVVVLCLVLTPLARAQPLADRLPGSTMVYLGWSPDASLGQTAAARMLADERLMGPWRKLFRELVTSLPEIPGGRGVAEHVPALLSEAARCQGCFALLELKPVKGGMAPQSVLMIDLGARRKTFEEHFQPIHAQLRQRLGDRLQMMKLEKSWVWYQADGDGRPRLTWGFVGDTFVMFFGESAAEFIPQLTKGAPDNPLKTAPAFVESVGKIPGESVFTTYLDVKASFALLKRLAERGGGRDLELFVLNWDKLMEELGVANVVGLGEKTVIEEKQFVTRSLLRTQGEPRGLLALVAQPGVDEAMMKAIPADAMAAAAFRLDLAKFYEQVKVSAIKIAGKDAEDGFRDLERGAEGFGLPLNDFLSSLGDQWAVYNAQSQGGLVFTGWTLVGTVRDAQKFRKSTDVLRGALAGMLGNQGASRIRQIDADGVRVEYVQLGRWSTPFAPAWAVVGDKLVVALYPQHVEDAVAHIKGGGKSLLDHPEYVAARKRTGGEGPMLYTSGPRVAENLYPLGLVVASLLNSFSGNDEGPMSAADLLPSLQRLLRYVGHDVVSVRRTADGILKTRTVANPLLSPLAWVDSPVVGLAVLVPTIHAMEERQGGGNPQP